jgi:hypothetical protein
LNRLKQLRKHAALGLKKKLLSRVDRSTLYSSVNPSTGDPWRALLRA